MVSFKKAIFVPFLLSPSQSFTISRVHHLPGTLPFEIDAGKDFRLFASVESKNDISTNEEKKGMTTLHFRGEKMFQTDPLPLGSIEILQSFFEQEKDQIRTILLSGSSGSNMVMALPSEEGIESKQAWSKQCKVVGASLPSFEHGDVVYRVNADGMNMGGLRIKNEMLIGATMIEPEGSKKNESPEYQFVFISDKRIAEGPRLLVWVFNKLMGGGKKDEEENEQAITSLTRFYAKVTSKDEVIFTIESFLDIAVQFPSFMLKILPVSKEKAEEEGSASVMKTLIKDTEPVLTSLSQFYLKSISP